MMCQIPQKAAMIAIPPKPLKKLKIKINPKPEFCNPTSNVIARLFAWLKPNSLPKPYPPKNATALCIKTMKNTT